VNASQEAVLVTPDDRLEIRRLDVLRTEPDRILVRGGLSPGDRVVVAGVDVPVAGMTVRPQTGELAVSDAAAKE
jgi:multidrug efflux pump subunit AcrA (membrane-fusion protein)